MPFDEVSKLTVLVRVNAVAALRAAPRVRPPSIAISKII